MTDCPKCGYPLVWSIDKARRHCAVYGDHRPAPALFAELVRLIMDLEDEQREAA